MQKKNYLSLVLSIITFICIIIIVFIGHKSDIGRKEQKHLLDSLANLHRYYQTERVKEYMYRDSIQILNDKTLANLKDLKKRDSLDQLKDIKYLIKKNKALSDAQLDSTTTAIFNQLTHP